ncbi:hypothetical protein [Oceanirhabdus sp. W0125-5]|uniref:hypothetical protein n=1 Tax=Oceanirhabdus sp. W0125-5 TaxID=2999116 RepID=UPI0022F2B070|nr:hypothetical protein [Oceanirhabdus sp. W0125-5]WBW96546.1 hypothetical protein OW730_23060 [Oceanirhabdus sp. W0125-5]
MKRIELSKGKIFLIICISLFVIYIGNKIYTNKVINSMEIQIGRVIEPVIERIKLKTIEEMPNGKVINKHYTLKFNDVEISSYNQENIKKALHCKAVADYVIYDEEGEEWCSNRLTIPVVRKNKKEEFKIEWTKINDRGFNEFYVRDIIQDYEHQEYSNYKEFIKSASSKYLPDEEEKYSECSGSGRHNGDDIEFDENGNIIKVEKFEYMMTWTGELATMKIQCEYNLKEFTGEENGDGIIINLKKTARSKDPLVFVEINNVEKINFYKDKEDGTKQEIIEISDKEKIEKIYDLFKGYKYEYIVNEQYYELQNNIIEDMHISFDIKGSPYFYVIINKNGVFASNQQSIISHEKSREILEKLKETIQE